MKLDWLIYVGFAGAAYWLWKSGSSAKPASPVVIDSLSTTLGSGPTVEEEVALFDQLFGIRDSSREFAKFKASAANLQTRICHSDGTCETQSGVGSATRTIYPLRGPKYLLDYLGVNP